MGIDTISELVAIILAISLATERFVTIVRTPHLIGQFFNDGKDTGKDNGKEEGDGPRRMRVQLLSYLSAWVTSSFLVADGWDLLGQIKIGEQTYHVAFVAFLAMGGSSFWKNFLGYTKAVRDIRVKELKT